MKSWIIYLLIGTIIWSCDPHTNTSGESQADTQSGMSAGEFAEIDLDVGATTDASIAGEDFTSAGEQAGGETTSGEQLSTCGPEGPTRLYTVVTLSFAEPIEGISPGFDLDELQSETGDPQSCGKTDYQTMSGQTGIDNQFANLLPIINPLVNRPINEALAETISEGKLILLIEIEGLDDTQADDCVNVNLFRAQEGALFGGDGLLLAGQSYALDLTQPWARTEGARIHDGELITGSFDFALPLNFFGEEMNVSLTMSRLALKLNDSDLTGTLAGGLKISEFVDEVAMTAADFTLIAQNILNTHADLLPNESGRCEAISVVWTMQTRSGHLYVDTARPESPPVDFSREIIP